MRFLAIGWAHARRTPGRTIALLLGVLLAASGFTVLSGTTRTSQVQVTSTVNERARTAYDIVVRPTGTRGVQETKDKLVPGTYLSGTFGGITRTQYRKIAKVPGVDVAAPLEILGSIEPMFEVPVDVTALTRPGNSPQLLKAETTWLTDRGATRIPDDPAYLYLTGNELLPRQTPLAIGGQFTYAEEVHGSRLVQICGARQPQTGVDLRFRFQCESRHPGEQVELVSSDPLDQSNQLQWATRGERPGHRYVYQEWTLNTLIAAVDPVAEAKMSGLDRSVVSGRYLRPSDSFGISSVYGSLVYHIPVLASSSTESDLTAQTRVHLSADGTRAATVGADAVQLDRVTAKDSPGRVVATTTSMDIQRQFLGELFHRDPTTGPTVFVDAYRTGGPLRYTQTPAGLVPQSLTNVTSTWWTKYIAESNRESPSTRDTNYHRLVRHRAIQGGIVDGQPFTSVLGLTPYGVGTFDPHRIAGFDDPDVLPLSPFLTAATSTGDAASTARLGGRPLLPNGSQTSYVQQTPTLITSMSAAEGLVGSAFENRVGAPISSIRIRVAGVTGADPVSRARIGAVVAKLRTMAPDLDVEVTLGASTSHQRVILPAGRFGRPQVTLSENWVRFGVAQEILDALNVKSLVLFVLILVVCVVFVANAAFASVRTRVGELGVLACLGWSPPRLFALVAGELVVVGAVAGAMATVISVPVARAFGAEVGWARAAIAIPASVAVALVAGLVPALMAARAAPMEAVRSAARPPRRAAAVSGVLTLAWVTVRRRPGRTALAASGLVIAVGAFSLLLAVTLGFRGTLVGSVLGSVVDVEVSAVDYAATGAILLLAAFGVADVVFISLSERAGEFATLRALGWREGVLGRLLLNEGLLIGLLGSLLGATVGLIAVAAFGSVNARVLLGVLVAAVVGVAVAGLASVVTVAALRRLPTVELLSAAE